MRKERPNLVFIATLEEETHSTFHLDTVKAKSLKSPQRKLILSFLVSNVGATLPKTC